MGLIVKKIGIVDFPKKIELYSKNIRGNLQFFIETHHLNKGKNIQILLYRDHPEVKRFIEFDKIKHYLTQQNKKLITDNNELQFFINDKYYMITGPGPIIINILEYNFNKQLNDFDKGKVAILINIDFTGEIDNTKVLTEIRDLNKEEKNNEK